MNRRRFTTALVGFAAARPAQRADTDRRTRFYQLEKFQLKVGTQRGRMHEWLSNGLLPKLSRIHSGPAMVLEALIGPHVPHLLLLTGYSSFEEIWNVRSKLGTDAEPNASGPEPPFESRTVTLLEAASYSPEIVVERREEPRFFELRVYHSRIAGAAEVKIFHRTGIFPVLYTSTLIGANMPNLTYLIPFDSLAAREKAWDAFGADPEWIKARKESIHRSGHIASVSEIGIYRVTPYSPC